MGLSQLAGCLDFGVSGILLTPAHIFLNSPGKEHIGLQDHGHLAAQAIQVVVTDILSAHLDSTGFHIVETRNELNQAGFTRPGPP